MIESSPSKFVNNKLDKSGKNNLMFRSNNKDKDIFMAKKDT